MDVIAIVISVLSFLYTIYVTDRFGLKSKIYDKKLSVTLELLEALKSYTFFGFIKNNEQDEWLTWSGSFSIRKDMTYFSHQYHDYYDVPLYFNYEEYRVIFKTLMELKNNPYLDKAIAESMAFLESPYYIKESPRNLPVYAIVIKENNDSKMFLNPTGFPTFGTFIDKMKGILLAIEVWLEKETKLKNQIRI